MFEIYREIQEKCVQTGCTTYGVIIERMKKKKTYLVYCKSHQNVLRREPKFAYREEKTGPKTVFFSLSALDAAL